MVQGYTLILRFAFAFLLISLAYGVALAQKQGQARVDSLIAEIPSAKADSNHVKLLYTIGFELASTNASEALRYAEQTMKLARQIRWPLGIVGGCNLLGNIYFYKSDMHKALQMYLTGLKLAESIHSQYYISKLANNIGNIYTSIGNNPKAIEYYQKSLQIEQRMDPSGKGIAPSLVNLGTIYKRLKDYPQAIINLKQALTLSQQLNQKDIIGVSLVSLGSAYMAQQELVTSLRYLQQGLQIQKETGDGARVASTYDDVAQLYLRASSQPRQLPP